MVRPRVVGPNLPSGVRRPDRSVDLRGMPVQTMGLAGDVHGEYQNVPKGPFFRRGEGMTDEEWEEFLDRVEEAGGDPYDPSTWPEWALEEGSRMEAVSPVGPQMLPNVPVPNFQGPQVHAMAGNGPPNWQEDLPLGDRPGRRLTPAQIAAGKAGVETAKGILEGTVEPPPEPVETPEPPPPVQDELFPDPEARSLDAAMLQELFLQRASEPDYGYFGRTGDKVGSIIDSVGDMSASDRAALVGGLIAAGVLMVGSGGTLIPAGAALLGGAGLGALTSAP